MALERSMRRRFLGKMGPFRKVMRLTMDLGWMCCFVPCESCESTTALLYKSVRPKTRHKEEDRHRLKTYRPVPETRRGVADGHEKPWFQRLLRGDWNTDTLHMYVSCTTFGLICTVVFEVYDMGWKTGSWILDNFCRHRVLPNGRLCTRDMFSQRRTMGTKIFAQRTF